MNAPYGYTWTISYKKAKSYHPIIESKQVTTFEESKGGTLACLQGKQAASSLNGVAELIGKPSTLGDLCQYGQKFYNATTASWVQVDDPAGVTQWTTFLLKKLVHTFTATNLSPSTVELDIYYCMHKLTDDSTNDPYNAWQQGLIQEAANSGGSGIANPEYVNAVPQQSKRFNTEYKIIKTLKYHLQPGQECKSNFVFNVRRYLDTAYVNTSEHLNIRGITIVPLIVLRGVPGAIGSAASYSNTGVTTTPAKIGYTCNLKYEAVMCSTFPKISRINNTLKTAALPGAAGDGVFTISDAAGTTVNNNTSAVFA